MSPEYMPIKELYPLITSSQIQNVELSLCLPVQRLFDSILFLIPNLEYFSLNLANAVQIITYEIYCAINSSLEHLKSIPNLASFENNQGLLLHFDNVLNRIDWYESGNKELNEKLLSDYFHLNEANFGGAKSNLFTDQKVEQKYNVSSDGTFTKTVTVNYKNPHEPSDCNLERGNLCLNAVLRDWFRVYVPKGSKLTASQGSEVKMKTYDELGKTVLKMEISEQTTQIDVSTLSSGMYVLIFVTENETATQKLIVA